MSHFYGTVQGARGKATRTGGKDNGLTTIAASWGGAVETVLYVDEQGHDCARVSLIPWKGKGASALIYDGRLS
jgi:hypothetical protein